LGFGRGDVDRLGQSVDARNATGKMRYRHATAARVPWLCRFLAGLSTVSPML